MANTILTAYLINHPEKAGELLGFLLFMFIITTILNGILSIIGLIV